MLVLGFSSKCPVLSFKYQNFWSSGQRNKSSPIFVSTLTEEMVAVIISLLQSLKKLQQTSFSDPSQIHRQVPPSDDVTWEKAPAIERNRTT